MLLKQFFIGLGFTITSTLTAIEKPNILWLTCEDNSASWIGCYGNEQANTPNIDGLAKEGFQYMKAFANAPVCAPSRSTWITGVNAISMGTHPMRSRNEIPHDKIPYYPDILKQNGYYCSNVKKTDFNIGGRDDNDCWDSTKLDWKILKQKQPFFQIINTTKSHESQAQGDVENTKHDPANTTLRKYHPDLPDIRKNYAKYHDCISRMDAEIGKSLVELKKSGMEENTIVIYNSDHGGVLPRSKRFLFDSGIHCPLIIRIPEKFKHLWPADKPGSQIDRLVSFVDMPKTWLSITGSKTPNHLQGTTFLGPNTETEQAYHVAFRGRMDERNDNLRAVRDKQFLYVRNYMPYAPWGQHLSYLWKMKATQAWQAHVKSGQANAVTSRFFNPKPFTEELYDTQKDPDNINNLAQQPEMAAIVKQKRVQLNQWQEKMFDAGLLPEADMVKRAADNNMTIYEMVRKPELYDLKAYLAMSELALLKDPTHLSTFINGLKNTDAGVRYWSMIGLFLLDQQASSAQENIRDLLNDSSHEVRAMAAWFLIKMGDEQAGLNCLSDLLTNKSYASLKVLNIIDWMGAPGKKLIPLIQKMKFSKYEERMQSNLMEINGLPPTYAGKKKKPKKT
jgi:N-sulfoglucosamine sulfohydrolase